METEPQAQKRATLEVRNASGKGWTGTRIEINGKSFTTNNRGIVVLQGFIGQVIYSLVINGKRANIKSGVLTAGMSLVFQHCMLKRSTIQQILNQEG